LNSLKHKEIPPSLILVLPFKNPQEGKISSKFIFLKYFSIKYKTERNYLFELNTSSIFHSKGELPLEIFFISGKDVRN